MGIQEPMRRFFQSYIVCDLRYFGESEQKLSYTDVLYVCLIAGNPKCTPSWIADTLGIARSAVTVRLKRLEEKGVIVRERSPDDGRVQFLDVSEEHRRDMDEFNSDIDDLDGKLRSRFTEDEIASFVRILDFISDEFEKA